MSTFQESYIRFEEAIPREFPMTYDDWLDCPDNYKAAALYVNFYDQITFAWYKVKTVYHNDEDAVSYILQYLCKNVPIIISNPGRYTERYIYRVAYNCFTCILYGPKRDRITSEVSNLQYTNSTDKEVNLFDFIQHPSNIEQQYLNAEIWRALGKLESSVLEFVEDIINRGAIPKRLTQAQSAALSEITKTLERFKDQI